MKIFLIFFLAFLFSDAYARGLDEIMSSGYVNIGSTDKNVNPMNFRRNSRSSNQIGIDVDLMKLISKELKLKPKLIPLNGMEDRINSLLTDRADLLISSFSVTEERRKIINLSSHYLMTGIGIVMRSKFKKDITIIDDLNKEELGNFNIAVVKDTLADTLLKQYQGAYPKIRVINKFKNQDQAISAVKKGTVDGYSNDLIFLKAMSLNSKYFYPLTGTLSSDPYAVGIKKGNDKLLSKINSIIEKNMANGVIPRIVEKYTKITPNKQSPIDKNAEIYHVTQKGDTLPKLALKYLGSVTKWEEIYNNNKGLIVNPNEIQEGNRILIRKKTIKKTIKANEKTVKDVTPKANEATIEVTKPKSRNTASSPRVSLISTTKEGTNKLVIKLVVEFD